MFGDWCLTSVERVVPIRSENLGIFTKVNKVYHIPLEAVEDVIVSRVHGWVQNLILFSCFANLLSKKKTQHQNVFNFMDLNYTIAASFNTFILLLSKYGIHQRLVDIIDG